MPTVVSLIAENLKFDQLVRCYSKNKQQARCQIPQVYAMLLFKMLSNMNEAARQIFLTQASSVAT